MRDVLKMENSNEIRFQDNSFDIIRLISAFLIILGHIEIHLSVKLPVWLSKLQTGYIGLFCLFVISGYVIPASFERSKTKWEYAVKWISRIYPALWGATIVSLFALIVFGIGYQGLDFSISDMCVWLFGQATVFQFYTPSTISAYGVGNPNGALWTISMEIQIYILIMIFYKLLKKQKMPVWLILIGGA